MSSEFPRVEGGGSLILAWQVRGKHVLVVGGGELYSSDPSYQVAAGRILNLLNADAHVTVVCPSLRLNPEVAYRVAQKQVRHVDRVFLPLDVEPDKNVAMVLTAIDDADASTRIWKYCKKLKIPANIADVPPECDFYFGSVHRDGPLQIMVSTNGNGPRIAASLRRQIAKTIPEGTGEAIARVGQLRRTLRVKVPGQRTEDISRRMDWMSRICDQWSTQDFNAMDEADMEYVVTFFDSSVVPSFEDVRLRRRPGVVWEYDGSFGWV